MTSHVTNRRALLAGASALAVGTGTHLAAIAAGQTETSAIALAADPIFALIEKQRELTAIIDGWDGGEFVEDSEADRIFNAWCEANSAMLCTKPTTLQGVIALFERLAEPAFDGADNPNLLLDIGQAETDEHEALKAFPGLLVSALRAIVAEGRAS